jgi:HD-like signal output (HDOD) protein
MTSIDTFFANIKLPTMSEVAHALIKTLNDEDASAADVRAIIAKDPALTAKLLRLANSAQFGLSRGVSSLDEAISMVGMSKVRTLSLGSCMNDSFPVLPGLDSKEFWQSCMACAGYAQWLAARVGQDAQQAWLTGMMLRLGELLIGQTNPSALQDIEKLPRHPGGRWEREVRLVGFSEGHITAELARRWNFPPAIVQALQQSSDPLAEKKYSRLGAVVHLAGVLADTPNADAAALETLPKDVLAALELEMHWLIDKLPSADSFISIA